MLCGTASAATVSVYDGVYGAASYFDPFFSSAGFTTNDLSSNFTASDIAGSKLVILSGDSSVTASQLSALDSYVSGGGRLVVQSDAAGFESFQTTLNAVSASLGSSIVNVDGAYDGLFHSTTAVLPSAFTAGVNTVQYAYTSSLTGGTPLVNGLSGQNFIAYQAIGSGYFFAIADVDTQEGLSSASVDNGQLYLNFANASVSAVPLPASAPMFGAALIALGAVGYGLNRKAKATA